MKSSLVDRKVKKRFGAYADIPSSSIALWHLVKSWFPGISFVVGKGGKIILSQNDGEKLPNANLNMGHGNGIDADTVDTKHADDFVLKDAGYNVVSKDIQYDSLSPQLIVQAKDGWIVKDVWVQVTTAWDTESKVNFQIGDPADNDGFFDAVANMDLTQILSPWGGYEMDERGAYLWDSTSSHIRQKVYLVNTNLNIYLDAGVATQGAATVYLGIVRVK